MKEELAKLLHTTVEEKEFSLLKKLPLFLKNGYEIKAMLIEGTEILFIKPKEQITVTALHKQWKRFELLTDLPCVVYGNEYSRYGRERMIELGIPFYFGKDNIYIPFLGIIFRKKRTIQLPEISKFSPTTQKMLLTALYENWQAVSTREISEKLKISRATAARCLAELQALNLPLVELQGKTKYFVYNGSSKILYNMCKEFFNIPISKIYTLAEIPDGLNCYGGFTAIARYSMLADNAYPTFAVTADEDRILGIGKYNKQSPTENPVCKVHVLRYKIEIDSFIDPISATLCVPAGEKEDPRIADAIDKLLEEVFHG